MVRDKVGSTREQDQLERWLNRWIVQYVDGDPKNSSEEVKARKPLADAKIKVIADEENPGVYSASVYLRPHFQLEAMDIGMSLVAKLEESKG
jgi:type VI secretion system protein ImpC